MLSEHGAVADRAVFIFWAGRFWLLRLLALGFLSLRSFLCVRLGRRLRLREAIAYTTQHSHEHLTTPFLTSTTAITTFRITPLP